MSRLAQLTFGSWCRNCGPVDFCARRRGTELPDPMGTILFIVICLNLAMYAGLGGWAWRLYRGDRSIRVRVIAGSLVLVSASFMLGAVTRLTVVAVQMSWLNASIERFILSEWHLVQSLAATLLGLVAVFTIRRHGTALRSVDRIAGAVGDRLLDGATLAELGLTRRELDVLEAIANGYVSDTDIGAHLFISPATAGTHVKNILRKTGLRSRRELMLLVVSSEL